MTWYFDPNSETVILYDPNGEVVDESIPFSGRWADYPADQLQDVVAGHLIEIAQQDIDTAVLWAFEWLSGDVEEGTP